MKKNTKNPPNQPQTTKTKTKTNKTKTKTKTKKIKKNQISPFNGQHPQHPSHQHRVNFIQLLSRPLQLHIFKYLNAYELCVAQRVCKEWAGIVQTNELWWRFAVQLLWTDGEQPQMANARALKKDPLKYKRMYKEAVVTHQHAAPKPVVVTQTVWEEEAMTKDQMRQYYKSIRSNPKGKKPLRDRTPKLQQCLFDDEAE